MEHVKIISTINQANARSIAKKIFRPVSSKNDIPVSTDHKTGLKATQIIWDANQTNTGTIPGTLLSDGYPINGVPTSTDWNTLLNNITVRLAALENSALPIGGWCYYDGHTLPIGFLWRDGSAVSRTTYSLLYAVSILTIAGTTTIGSPVITGISSTSNLYIGQDMQSPNFTGVVTIASIDSGTQITVSANATAGSTVNNVFHLWGAGDGTTTFNVGDSRGRSAMGAGQGAGLTNRIQGQHLGAEGEAPSINQLTPHTHGIYGGSEQAAGSGEPLFNDIAIAPRQSLPAGGGQPVNIIHPVEICNSIIRYQ